MVTSRQIRLSHVMLARSGQLRFGQFSSGKVRSRPSGSVRLSQLGQVSSGLVILLGVPDRSSRSDQFRSSQVGPFWSGGSVQVRSGWSDQVTPVRSV